MTAHEKPPYDLPHRHKIVESSKSSEIETKLRTEPFNSTTLQHQGISKLQHSHSAYFDDPTGPTKVLHQGKDDMPAITLTAYKDGAFPRQSLLQLHMKVVPAHDKDSVKRLEELVTDRPAQLDDQDEDLVRDLGVHFEALKSEFEETTGRAWMPLRAWGREDGEWDLVGEEEGGGD